MVAELLIKIGLIDRQKLRKNKTGTFSLACFEENMKLLILMILIKLCLISKAIKGNKGTINKMIDNTICFGVGLNFDKSITVIIGKIKTAGTK